MNTFLQFQFKEGVHARWLEPQEWCVAGAAETALSEVLHVGAHTSLWEVGSGWGVEN